MVFWWGERVQFLLCLFNRFQQIGLMKRNELVNTLFSQRIFEASYLFLDQFCNTLGSCLDENL